MADEIQRAGSVTSPTYSAKVVPKTNKVAMQPRGKQLDTARITQADSQHDSVCLAHTTWIV